MDDLYLQLESLTWIILSMTQGRPITYTLFILNGVLFIFLFPKLVDFRRTWLHKKSIKDKLYKQSIRDELYKQSINDGLCKSVIENEPSKQGVDEEIHKSAIDNELSKLLNESYKQSINDELRKQASIRNPLLNDILQHRRKIELSKSKCAQLKRSVFKFIDFKRKHLENLLEMANSNELANLRKVLSMTSGSRQDIASEIRSVGSHTIATFLRNIDGSDPHVSYMEVVDDVLMEVGGSVNETNNYFDKECQIIEQYTSQMMAEMSDVEKQQFIDGLRQEAENNGESFSGVIGAGGGILLANASGFGVYLLASSAVGSITALLGVTLPFAFYTSMSSTIALATGPIGWAVLGLWGVSKIGSPNKKKTLPSVMMVTSIRSRLIAENEKSVQLEKLNNEELIKLEYQNICRLQARNERDQRKADSIKMKIKDLEKQLSDINI